MLQHCLSASVKSRHNLPRTDCSTFYSFQCMTCVVGRLRSTSSMQQPLAVVSYLNVLHRWVTARYYAPRETTSYKTTTPSEAYQTV